jgi:transposase-like protein
MRLALILPRVELAKIVPPVKCKYEGCEGKVFRFLQEVDKALRDTVHAKVSAHRYECLRCKQSFRVYPQGVSRAQTSDRVCGLAVMLYLLGLSYGAVSLVLDALGVYLCKSRVYEVVQAAAERVPGLKREHIFEGIRTPALGGDITSVKCNGRWLSLGLTVDDTSGLVLTLDELTGEDAQSLKSWLEPIATAVGARLLVTDDADSLKTVADELALDHQVCKGHVVRNTEALIESYRDLAARDADGSLRALGVTPEQAVADLERLGQLIHSRRPEQEAELETMHHRYLAARPPRKGEQARIAYRLRLLFLDRWNLWPRLTRYRLWQGPEGQTVDGTNNGSERAIGWWVKERYRTMRGYKRPKSAVNVSRLLAWAGNHLGTGGADLATLIA